MKRMRATTISALSSLRPPTPGQAYSPNRASGVWRKSVSRLIVRAWRVTVRSLMSCSRPVTTISTPPNSSPRVSSSVTAGAGSPSSCAEAGAARPSNAAGSRTRTRADKVIAAI